MNLVLRAILVIGICFILGAIPAFSQRDTLDVTHENEPNYGNLGLGVSLAIPMGNFSDNANVGVGATILYSYPYKYNLDFLGSTGYLNWGGKNVPSNFSVSWSAVPIQAGARYLFYIGTARAYIGGLVGIHIFRHSVKDNLLNIKKSTSDTKFGIAPMIGYIYPLGKSTRLDTSLRYQFVTDNFSYFGIRAGIGFVIK